MADSTVIVRCASHRARTKLLRIAPAVAMFSWDRGCTGGFFEISTADLPVTLEIVGVTRARMDVAYQRCMSI